MTVNVKRLARSMTKRLMKFEARLTNCMKATIRMLLRSAKNCGTL
jgi:predicted component of type VI protein secretion system